MPMQNRIKALRKTRGITQNKFCEYLAIAQPTLSGYETNTYEPDFETACKIADYFSVSTDYLLGRTDMPVHFSELNFADNINPIDLIHDVRYGKVPILGSIAAGNPREALENYDDDDYVYCDTKQFGSKTVFGLRIEGSSMEPRICEGDIAIVEVCDFVESGSIAAVRVNGADTTLKKIKLESNGIWLIGLNQSFAPIYYTAKECAETPVTVIGKLIQVIQNY